ncbi:MAG: ABC transporter permease [Vicingaceae bacterium]
MILSIQTIPYFNLSLAFIPVVIVIVLLWKWKLNFKSATYAVFRMLVQLLLIGFVLAYIFKADESLIVMAVLMVMLISSSWIALGNVKISRKKLYLKTLLSILIGGGSVLILITQLVLDLETWFMPSYVIPLAGMIFANAMNGISLAGERLESEMERGGNYNESRRIALKASLIPITNSLLAVGLVSLPGMMTGQILSGVSPFIAARYQIMVMCMIFGSVGISSATFLVLIKDEMLKINQEKTDQ